MIPQSAPTTDRRRSPTRTWPVRAIAILLLLQAAGLVYIGYDLLADYDWHLLTEVTIETNRPPTAAELGISTEQIEAVETTVTFSPLALPAILAAVGFLFILRLGWVLAMMTQGLILWACLSRYFSQPQFFIYPLMLSCILMVLYLNTFHVRAVFQPPPAPQPGDDDDQ